MKKASMMIKACVVMALLLLCYVPQSAGEAENDENNVDFPKIEVTKQKLLNNGYLGRGDFIGIYNGDRDAMMGVLYGTEGAHNYIYIVSIYTRYLGVADVYEEDGELKKAGYAIPVRTIFTQKFENIFEFDDVDGDMLFDNRKSNGNASDFREPVVKRASLKTSWTPSEVEKLTDGNGTKEWSFSLTATNLAYKRPLLPLPVAGNDTLGEVTLTFHLYVDVEDRVAQNVPFYKVTVSEKGEGNYNVDSSEYVEDRTYSGRAVDAKFKYDHLIKGWDFDEDNSKPSLLLSTKLFFANGISDETAGWLRLANDDMVDTLGGDGKATFEDADGVKNMAPSTLNDDPAVNETGEELIVTGGDEKPKFIKKNKLHFQDNWDNLGGLEWVSDVEVDGEDMEMFFQVHGGRRVLLGNAEKGYLKGFGVIGGFSYPGGENIFHDPAFNSHAVSLEVEGALDEVRGGARLWILYIVIAVIAVLVAVYIFSGGKKKGCGCCCEKDL